MTEYTFLCVDSGSWEILENGQKKYGTSYYFVVHKKGFCKPFAVACTEKNYMSASSELQYGDKVNLMFDERKKIVDYHLI